VTREEFAGLVLSYLEEVTAYARRLRRSEWDADDLLQAAFEQAFRSWEQLADPGSCRAWLFRITRNLHIDHTRRTAARSELRLVEPEDVLGPEPTLAAEVVERLAARDLEEALARLPGEQREAVLLCDVWGFGYQEISEITEVPVGTVRSRIFRARSGLARALVVPLQREHVSKSGGPS